MNHQKKRHQPCKATGTGNLPRALCREAALSVLGQEKYDEMISIGNINREEDYPDLHTTRIVAENAGLLQNNGRFYTLSPACLLQRYGRQTRPATFYENAFFRAFPNMINEARPVSYKTQEETVKAAFNVRTIRRFFEFFGLAVLNPPSDVFSKPCDVTASPLAFEVVRFPDTMF